MKDSAQPGYNIIESKYMRNYVIPEEKIGILQFLRNVNRKKLISKSEFVITGLDKILYESQDLKEVCHIIRKELAEARKWIPKGLVLFFPVDGELRGREDEPILCNDGLSIDLKLLFGNRIERKSLARCHASFEIER